MRTRPPGALSDDSLPDSSSSDDESDMEEIRKMDEKRFAAAASLDVAACTVAVAAMGASMRDLNAISGSSEDEGVQGVVLRSTPLNLSGRRSAAGGSPRGKRPSSAAAEAAATTAPAGVPITRVRPNPF